MIIVHCQSIVNIMPQTCAVMLCKSRYKKTNINAKFVNFSFFQFPIKNYVVNSFWIKATGRPQGWLPNRNSRICSKHFNENYIKVYDGKPLLTPDAIPTLKLDRKVLAMAVAYTVAEDNMETSIPAETRTSAVEDNMGSLVSVQTRTSAVEDNMETSFSVDSRRIAIQIGNKLKYTLFIY